MDYVFVVKVGDGFDELKTDIFDSINGKGVIMLDELEQWLVSSVLDD